MRRPAVLTALLSLGLVAAAAAQDAEAEAAPPRCDVVLLEGDAAQPVFVRMTDQLFARGGAFESWCEERGTSPRSALRATTLAELRTRADASFALVRERIDTLLEQGQLAELRRFWIVNGFACEATPQAVRALVELDAVAFVHLQSQPGFVQHRNGERRERWLEERAIDEATALAHVAARSPEGELTLDGVEIPWNLQRVRAEHAWREGATGAGIVIALHDTGLCAAPPLLDALWRNPKETLDGKDEDGNGYVDDLFGWDFVGDTRFVVGDGARSHGTMCAGIAVGRPYGEPRTITGVAPRAQVMVLRGMGHLRAYEYAALMGADVLSLSYMWVDVELGSYRGVFRTAHEHLAACGVVAVGGAGNFGRSSPPGRQIALPKDIPCVIAAAGIVESGLAAPQSSRGPCTWDEVPFFHDHPPDAPLAKPDVTGCFGVFPVWHWTSFDDDRRLEVRWDDGKGFGLIVGPRGNSFAGPHAAGIAALMLSANPELTPWRIKSLMESSCLDLGDAGRDTTYGEGLLQADAAVAAARAAKVE